MCECVGVAGQGVSVPQCVCNGRRATTGQDAAVKRLNVQYKHHSTENHLKIQHGYEQHSTGNNLLSNSTWQIVAPPWTARISSINPDSNSTYVTRPFGLPMLSHPMGLPPRILVWDSSMSSTNHLNLHWLSTEQDSYQLLQSHIGSYRSLVYNSTHSYKSLRHQQGTAARDIVI